MLHLSKKGARALRERIRSALSKFHVGLGVQPSNKEGSFLLFGLAVHLFKISVSLLQRKSLLLPALCYMSPTFFLKERCPSISLSV